MGKISKTKKKRGRHGTGANRGGQPRPVVEKKTAPKPRFVPRPKPGRIQRK